MVTGGLVNKVWNWNSYDFATFLIFIHEKETKKADHQRMTTKRNFSDLTWDEVRSKFNLSSHLSPFTPPYVPPSTEERILHQKVEENLQSCESCFGAVKDGNDETVREFVAAVIKGVKLDDPELRWYIQGTRAIYLIHSIAPNSIPHISPSLTLRTPISPSLFL